MDALILAGGENKRMPVVKGFLEINSSRIIDSIVKLLKGIFDRVIISTNNPELYFYLGVQMVGDVIKCRGPMIGILSGLIATGASEIFVIACDMPFVKPELVRYIVDKWMLSTKLAAHKRLAKSYDALIPFFNKKLQPLFGIYSKSVTKTMEETIRQGRRSLRGFLQELDVLCISEEEVRAVDAEGRSFVNLNTMEDYKIAIGANRR